WYVLELVGVRRVVFLHVCAVCVFFFFFQAEDGIRDSSVTGVQTCALPICMHEVSPGIERVGRLGQDLVHALDRLADRKPAEREQIGRASCRERVEMAVVSGALKKKSTEGGTLASTQD